METDATTTPMESVEAPTPTEAAPQADAQPEATTTPADPAAEAAEATDAPVEPEAAPEPEVPKPPTEEERLIAKIEDNPSDFATWTQLLALLEREGNIEKIRAKFEIFLNEFPLCYGYWKKLADQELIHAKNTLVEGSELDLAKLYDVYEQGVASVSKSIDLWVHFCSFAQEYNQDVDAVRSDFLSHPFWEKYLDFELKQEDNAAHVAAVYRRIVGQPIQQVLNYFNRFKQWAPEIPTASLITAEESATLEKEVEAAIVEAEAAQAASAAPPAVPAEGEGETAPEALTEPTGDAAEAEVTPAAPAEGEAAAPAEGAMQEDAPPAPVPQPAAAELPPVPDKDTELRKRALALYEQAYEGANDLLKMRQGYEALIKRPYFHVKPVDEPQLNTWRTYLDFEIKEGNVDRTRHLFERCVVPCALYGEFWEKYATWLEKIERVDEARAVYQRASSAFLKARPHIFIAFALFEEAQGNVSAARNILTQAVDQIAPGLVQVSLALINFERRQHKLAAAHARCETLLQTLAEKETPDKEAHLFVSLYYAHMLMATHKKKDADKAQEVYEAAMKVNPESLTLLLSFVDFEITRKNIDRAAQLFDTALAADSPYPKTDQKRIWAHKLDFVRDHAGDVADLRAAEQAYREAHASLAVAAAEGSRKRAFEADSATVQQGMLKAARTAPQPAQQQGWGGHYGQYAGYGQQAQGYGQQQGAAAGYGAAQQQWGQQAQTQAAWGAQGQQQAWGAQAQPAAQQWGGQAQAQAQAQPQQQQQAAAATQWTPEQIAAYYAQHGQQQAQQ